MRDEKNTKSTNALIFGVVRYDLKRGQLIDSNDNLIRMRRQSLDVLAVLARSANQVVSKSDLVDAVWPGIATTDDSLVQCIVDIRKTLGRDSVETFPKLGYALRPDHTQADAKDPPPRRQKLWIQVAAAIVAVAVLAIVLVQHRGTEGAPEQLVLPAIEPDLKIAVLPFFNLSRNPDLRFFSDGLSADLTTDLSKISALTVISHASSADYPDTEFGFQTIAKELGVRYLVRGTVRHAGQRVRINVALVDPFEGLTLWAERYDRDRSDPFDIQEEVTRQIVSALSLRLGASKREPPRIEPDAQYMLLRGLEPFREWSPEGNAKARSFFERALDLDPQYARAHANIAITYGRDVVFRNGHPPAPDSIAKGLEAAVRAIQLDPEIPHAYFALGVLNLALGDHDKAMSAARHAVRLNTNFADGYALLAEAAVYGGELPEALAAIQRARILHPHHSFSYHWVEGLVHFHLESHQKAQAHLKEALRQNPTFYHGMLVLASSAGHVRDHVTANKALAEASQLFPATPFASALSQMPYQNDERRRFLEQGISKIEPN